jgi:DNA-binding transcriptional ArsR family regulator
VAPHAPQVFPDEGLKALEDVFKSLADKNRLKILQILSGVSEMHVNALCGLLAQSQPAVSHHLTQLKHAGLVGFRRDGKYNFYRFDPGALGSLIEKFLPPNGHGQQKIELGGHVVAIKKK